MARPLLEAVGGVRILCWPSVCGISSSFFSLGSLGGDGGGSVWLSLVFSRCFLFLRYCLTPFLAMNDRRLESSVITTTGSHCDPFCIRTGSPGVSVLIVALRCDQNRFSVSLVVWSRLYVHQLPVVEELLVWWVALNVVFCSLAWRVLWSRNGGCSVL